MRQPPCLNLSQAYSDFMSNPDTLIAYWRASLAVADCVSIDARRALQSDKVHPTEIAAGRVRPEIAARLSGDGRDQRGAQPVQMLSILLCPLVAHPAPGSSQTPGEPRGPLLGYEGAKVETTNLTRSVNTNQDIPQGQVATVTGTITYADSVQGTFRAVLEREDDAWKLFSINVTVPPSKFTAAP